jgi:hypothetical protein
LLRKHVEVIGKVTLLLLSLILLGAASRGRDALNIGVALLDLTGRNSESQADLLGLKHALEAAGIPYALTADLGEATKYHIICTASFIGGNTLSPQEGDGLYDFVRQGGVLVSAHVLGNRYGPLFGISSHEMKRTRHRLTFEGKDAALKYLDRNEEKNVPLGGKDYPEVIWSQGVEVEKATPLARFDDGSVAVAVNRYEKGKAYLLGITYTDSVLRPQIGRDFSAQRAFVNAFEPGSDTIALLLKGVYEENMKPYIYLNSAPGSREGSLILTHDLKDANSFKESLKFAELEGKYSLKSTFFVTTKYFADRSGPPFYVGENIKHLAELKDKGFDVASHTVSNSPAMSNAELGETKVDDLSYQPENSVTLFGEALVSKNVLERDVAGAKVLSFRNTSPGYPDRLIEALGGSGYFYDSSFYAGDILTNFPFRALVRREFDSPESKVLELPITLSDEGGFLTSSNEGIALGKWLDVIWANRDNGATTVLSLTPSGEPYKLSLQEKLLQRVRRENLWVGDLTSFGAFSRARLGVRLEAALSGNRLQITLRNLPDSSQAGGAAGPLGIVMGNSSGIRDIVISDANGKRLKFKRETSAGGRIYLIVE